MEGDVGQPIHVHHLVVHEVWEGDPDGEQEDTKCIEESPRLGWTLQEYPAKKATRLHEERVHHRDVPVDADDGHHHHCAGLQHLLEWVEKIDVKGRIEVRVDGGRCLWSLLYRLN